MSGGPALVRWTAKNQAGETAGWAGTGVGVAKAFDEHRDGGAAVLVEFQPNPPKGPTFDAWIPPGELEQITNDQETAS